MKYLLDYGFIGCASHSMSFRREDAARRAYLSLVSRSSLRFASLKSEDGLFECNFAKL